jgi:2-aminobenzoate-CoA ligase
MHDLYPALPDLPAQNLVAAGAQPDYAAAAGLALPDDANIGVYLTDRQVATYSDQLAAIDATTGRSLTFRHLAQESNRIAAMLVRLGIRPGERVAYRSPNLIDVLPVMAGIWKAGAVVTPIPLQATAKDIRFYIDDTGARFLLAHVQSGGFSEMAEAARGSTLEEILGFGPDEATAPGFRHVATLMAPEDDNFAPIPVHADMPAIIWHTGGTTGTPKGCYHTHRRFLLGGYAIGLHTGIQPGERWLAAAPIGHALGIIYNTIYTLLHGATVVMIESFADARLLLQAVHEHKVDTLTALAPSWAKMLAVVDTTPGAAPRLKRAYAMWQSASSSEIYDRWLGLGVELLNNFGSTSFATWVLTPAFGMPSPRGALGRPLPGYRVEAVSVADGVMTVLPHGEIGQMAVRGPTGLTYWNRPDMQQRDVVDGWTLQDDLIQYDAAGNAHYLGRTDYMISTGGYKVAPAEVEEALTRHPAVQEVAVVPGPCPINREMVVAYIVLRPNLVGSPELSAQLRDFVKARLVSYKAPRRFEYVDSLPRDQVGKVQTKIIKQWAYDTPQ